MTAAWTGWLRQDDAWEPVATGETIGDAARALDVEVKRRGLKVHNRDLGLTSTGGAPTWGSGKPVAKAVAGQ